MPFLVLFYHTGAIVWSRNTRVGSNTKFGIDEVTFVKILYYPNMGTPNETWLRKVLPYTDKIATIMPEDFWHMCETGVLKLLREEGQYEPLAPEEFLRDQSASQNFDEAIRQSLPVNSRRTHRINRAEDRPELVWLYGSKFSESIRSSLKSTGHLKEGANNWASLDAELGHAYITILATHMALKYSYFPGTDSMVNEERLLRQSPARAGAALGFMKLQECFPVPESSTSIEQILKLKSGRQKEFIRFQLILVEFQSKFSKAHPDEFLEIQLEFKKKIQIALDEISEYYHDYKINTVFRSVKSIFNFSPKTASVLMAMSAGFIPGGNPGHEMLSYGVSAGILLGSSVIGTRSNLRNKLLTNSYSYVFHVNELGKESSRKER